jgi:hypothetical protein
LPAVSNPHTENWQAIMQKVSLGTELETTAGAKPLGIQLLVLDIDGTIAGESNEISQPVRRAIQARKVEESKWRSQQVGCTAQP